MKQKLTVLLIVLSILHLQTARGDEFHFQNLGSGLTPLSISRNGDALIKDNKLGLLVKTDDEETIVIPVKFADKLALTTPGNGINLPAINNNGYILGSYQDALTSTCNFSVLNFRSMQIEDFILPPFSDISYTTCPSLNDGNGFLALGEDGTASYLSITNWTFGYADPNGSLKSYSIPSTIQRKLDTVHCAPVLMNDRRFACSFQQNGAELGIGENNPAELWIFSDDGSAKQIITKSSYILTANEDGLLVSTTPMLYGAALGNSFSIINIVTGKEKKLAVPLPPYLSSVTPEGLTSDGDIIGNGTNAYLEATDYSLHQIFIKQNGSLTDITCEVPNQSGTVITPSLDPKINYNNFTGFQAVDDNGNFFIRRLTKSGSTFYTQAIHDKKRTSKNYCVQISSSLDSECASYFDTQDSTNLKQVTSFPDGSKKCGLKIAIKNSAGLKLAGKSVVLLDPDHKVVAGGQTDKNGTAQFSATLTMPTGYAQDWELRFWQDGQYRSVATQIQLGFEHIE